MENVLKYFEFSDFLEDQSHTFSGLIAYSELNAQHFMIFEKKDNEVYHLYVTRFKNKSQIGKDSPEIHELLVENYDKSNPVHRIAIRRYYE